MSYDLWLDHAQNRILARGLSLHYINLTTATYVNYIMAIFKTTFENFEFIRLSASSVIL